MWTRRFPISQYSCIVKRHPFGWWWWLFFRLYYYCMTCWRISDLAAAIRPGVIDTELPHEVTKNWKECARPRLDGGLVWDMQASAVSLRAAWWACLNLFIELVLLGLFRTGTLTASWFKNFGRDSGKVLVSYDRGCNAIIGQERYRSFTARERYGWRSGTWKQRNKFCQEASV